MGLHFFSEQENREKNKSLKMVESIWNVLIERLKAGVEMLPVYLSISGTFQKWQVKNIEASRWRQARKSLIIQNLLIWIILSSVFHPHSCSFGSHCRDSRTVVTSLYSIKAGWCNFCSAHDKDRWCHVTMWLAFLRRSSMKWILSVDNMRYGSFSEA